MGNGKSIYMEEMTKRVYKIVANQFEVKPKEIQPNTHFKHDLGADSMDLIMIVVEVENTYGFTIPDEELPKMLTPSMIIDAIQRFI